MWLEQGDTEAEKESLKEKKEEREAIGRFERFGSKGVAIASE